MWTGRTVAWFIGLYKVQLHFGLILNPIGGCGKMLIFCFFLQIRKEYFEDTITAGPQSTVLEGVTWEEAQRIKVSSFTKEMHRKCSVELIAPNTHVVLFVSDFDVCGLW